MHKSIDEGGRFARLLTTSLTEPGALSLDALRDSIDQQVEHSEPATREWIAAVRSVQRSGLLTSEQADAMVVEIAFSWQGDLNEKAELFSSLGDDDLASGTHVGRWDFHAKARQPFVELMYGLDNAERQSAVEYPSWADENEAPATSRPAWLGFHDGIDDDGISIASIQRSRAQGVFSEDVAWFLLDRMAEATMSRELAADPVLREIEERIDCVEFDGGGPAEGNKVGSREGASATWLALDAARERRVALFKRRVLAEAGEHEMVRAMKERPDEFRRRVGAVGRSRAEGA
jgi:hypothetical protein